MKHINPTSNIHSESLKKMPYAQARIYTCPGRVDLVSYTTRVASIITENGKTRLECTGLYSATTRKHISAFARQFGFTYEDFKIAYMNGGTRYV